MRHVRCSAVGLAVTALMLSVSGREAQTPNNAWPAPVQRVGSTSPALSPADSMKTFHMPPGYRVELVASEPMVVDPVVIDFDPDGRMWVVEMLGFMPDRSGTDSREPIGRVAVLEDQDDDGRMDRRTTFLDKLILPRALKVLERGVLVGEPPNLWLARDRDGDLVADAKELVRDDYGRLEANPEHNANGLHWGIDNWIYTSEHGYHLQLRDGRFIVHATLNRGQWGVAMDDGGRLYRNWNEQPLFVDYVPARYYARNASLLRTRGLYELLMAPADMTVWPVRPTRGVNRGYRDGVLREDGTLTTYVSAGTPTIYRGDRLPAELYGDAFITESAGNLVHRLKVVDDGRGNLRAENAYQRGEFLASADERFRPVNLFSAPDGTLYVVDMYRGVIQDGQYWTDYLRDYIRKHELELPVGLGRIYRVVHETTKRERKPSLSRETPAGLVRFLSHPNGWHRDTAHRMLVERGDKSVVAALTRLVASGGDWRTRLHALWVLDGLDSLDVPTVRSALEDPAPDVRASAIRLSERWIREPFHPLTTAVLARSGDANWIVRRQLAASIGEMPASSRRDESISLLLRYPDDSIVVDATISGLAGSESDVLNRVLQRTRGAENGPLDPIQMLAGAIAKSRDASAIEDVIAVATDEHRPLWQRVALLRGVETGLDGGTGGRSGGRGSSRFSTAAPVVELAREPLALASLASGNGELGAVAARIARRLTWPGKPAPGRRVTPLNADEQQRFAKGHEVYKNLCIACHQVDGQGREKMAPPLVNSPFAVGDPTIAMRIVLAGKEGKVGLMPPQAWLSDEQIASVLTYIRREWGHTASPVTTAEVREIRGMTASRQRPWTEDELVKLIKRQDP